MKEIYRFTTHLEKEVEKAEKEMRDGQEISVTKKVKEKVPYHIILKKPTRSEQDSFRLFYGAQIKRAVDNGLLTKAVLINKHIDGAGALMSKDTAKRLANLTEEVEDLKNDLVRVSALEKTQESQKSEEVILIKLLESQREIEAIESSNQVIFNNTAEVYAQERANLWLILNQSYIEDAGEVKPLFKGVNFAEKEEFFFDLEDNKDELFDAYKERLVLYWGLYSLGRASTKEDFERYEQAIKQQMDIQDKADKEDEVKEPEPEEKLD